MAKNLFSTQDMTHNPDMIFGGPDVVINFGDSSVNRSLGQVTKKESDAYRQWLSQQDPDALVNVKIVFTYTGTQQQGPKTSTGASA